MPKFYPKTSLSWVIFSIWENIEKSEKFVMRHRLEFLLMGSVYVLFYPFTLSPFFPEYGLVLL